MRIASFNINGIKARLPRLKEWLEETRPTVACLQEIKTMDDGFPADEFAAIGYNAIWHGQKSFNGVAILARDTQPVETQRRLPGDDDDEQARYLEADVNGLRVATIYLPNGNPQPGPKFDYKLAWMRRLRARAAKLRELEMPAVLAGDFGHGDHGSAANAGIHALRVCGPRGASQRCTTPRAFPRHLWEYHSVMNERDRLLGAMADGIGAMAFLTEPGGRIVWCAGA